MERVMNETPRQRAERVNAHLAELMEDARRALRGEAEFNVTKVRRLRQALEEMTPIAARSAELRLVEPELAGEINRYEAQLRELQTTLQQIRVMLLARRASFRATRAQMNAVSRWASAFHQTR
jgi:DNA repair exonuclease SbcCD ATPase subunit